MSDFGGGAAYLINWSKMMKRFGGLIIVVKASKIQSRQFQNKSCDKSVMINGVRRFFPT